MYQVGNKVVYRGDVCLVAEIDENYINGEGYYMLSPVRDPKLIIRVPINKAPGVIRPLMTKTEVEALVKKISKIPVIEIENRNRGGEYKELLSRGRHEDIVCVIKTAYLRQEKKVKRHQSPGEGDKLYFNQAERMLYSEIAAVLDSTYDEAKEYVVRAVSALAASEG